MLLFLLNVEGPEVIEEAPKETSDDQEVSPLSILEEVLGVGSEEETSDDDKSKDGKPNEELHPENEILVTEEMTKQFPALKGLEGKPITAVAEQYTNMNVDYQGTKRELSEMKKQIATLTAKDKVEDPPPEEEIPDPLVDSKGFADYMKKQGSSPEEITTLVKDAVKEQLAKAEHDKVTAGQKQTEITNAIVEVIPEGMHPIKAMQSFFNDNPELLGSDKKPKPDVVKFYSENIDVFAKNVGAHMNNNYSDEEIKKRAKSEAYRHMKDNLTVASKATTKKSLAPRSTHEDLTDKEKFVNTIIEMSYNPEDWGDAE